MVRNMNEGRILALRLGATNFGLSDKPNKLYYVVYNGKHIHFGSKRFDYNGPGYTTWIARNMRHKNADGHWVATTDKTKPSFWVHYIC